MKMKLYAHLSVLFYISAFIFLVFYFFLHQFLALPIIVLLSFGISEIIIHFLLEIRVVPFEES